MSARSLLRPWCGTPPRAERRNSRCSWSWGGSNGTMLSSVISQFSIPGTLVKAGRFGSGLINDTYLCEFSDKGAVRKYILQRINTAVFKRPEQVMENVEAVTTHIVRKLAAAGVADPL